MESNSRKIQDDQALVGSWWLGWTQADNRLPAATCRPMKPANLENLVVGVGRFVIVLLFMALFDFESVSDPLDDRANIRIE